MILLGPEEFAIACVLLLHLPEIGNLEIKAPTVAKRHRNYRLKSPVIFRIPKLIDIQSRYYFDDRRCSAWLSAMST